MKKPVKIGRNNFGSKKEALAHYKEILNSYKIGQFLNDAHTDDIVDLMNLDYNDDILETEAENIPIINQEINSPSQAEAESSDDSINSPNIYIRAIRVSKVQYGARCFEVVYTDNSSCYISYLMLLNNQKYTPEKLFSTACRNCIQKDLMDIKQAYFDANSVKGLVKCQETGKLSSWTDLAVDHRQPNTFSIIIERFIEVNTVLELNEIKYRTTKSNLIIFEDDNLTQNFIQYHSEKANLRIVRKENNSARASLGRVKRTGKDLILSPKSQLSLF